jgi:GT2 family glycosyltransferase
MSQMWGGFFLTNYSSVRPLKLFAVIVLYKVIPQDSVSYQSLLAAMECVPPSSMEIEILFYDNTPGGQNIGSLPEGVRWESHGENNGLAIAYNRALEMAADGGYEWLLTLDQDTSLPTDFLSKLGPAIDFVTPLSQVASIVPKIFDKARLISPNGLRWDIFPTFFPSDFVGISLEPSTSAINSASTLRVSALRAIGGYDLRFPLDYCDAVMYRRLYAKNLRIFILGTIRVDHELSVLDMAARVTLERYASILGAESVFWDEYISKTAAVSLFFRYLYRIGYKLWQTGGSFSYVRISLRFFGRRIFYSRRRRMLDWEQSVKRPFVLSE